jgi:hypothetical protein
VFGWPFSTRTCKTIMKSKVTCRFLASSWAQMSAPLLMLTMKNAWKMKKMALMKSDSKVWERSRSYQSWRRSRGSSYYRNLG